MAFVKIGDANPILEFYSEEGKEVCKKCGSPLVTVALDGNTNKLICECCEIEQTEDDE